MQLMRQPDCRPGLQRGEEKAPDSASMRRGRLRRRLSGVPTGGAVALGVQGRGGAGLGPETVLHGAAFQEGELGKAYWTEGRPKPWQELP